MKKEKIRNKKERRNRYRNMRGAIIHKQQEQNRNLRRNMKNKIKTHNKIIQNKKNNNNK